MFLLPSVALGTRRFLFDPVVPVSLVFIHKDSGGPYTCLFIIDICVLFKLCLDVMFLAQPSVELAVPGWISCGRDVALCSGHETYTAGALVSGTL